MIIICHDYRSISHKEMTDNFLIRHKYVKKVWDINPGVVGIQFVSTYDKYEYRIELDGDSKNLLAKDILKMVKENSDATITGMVKPR